MVAPVTDTACTQVCGALLAVAAAGVVHRDVAARNVLVAALPPAAPLSVKLADFGLAIDLDIAAAAAAAAAAVGAGHHVSGKVGTVATRWAAPEGLERGVWTEASDVWSFGVLMWEVNASVFI